MSNKPNQSTASPSDAASATTNTASTPKKLRSQSRNQSADFARAWPFTRVDGKLLEKAHRAHQKQAMVEAEPAPF